MRALAAALAGLVAVLLVSGCGGSHHSAAPPLTGNCTCLVGVVRTASTNGTGRVVVPVGAKAWHDLERHLYTARFLAPTRLAIPGIIGSSNCPSVPDKLIVRNSHAIRVKLVVGSWGRADSGLRVQVPHSAGICLDDLHPVPVVIAINPNLIDVRHQLKVSLYYPKGTVRHYKRPVVFTVPPLATAQVREEVRIARASNRIFAIFPAVPGKEICFIPHNTRPAQDFRGTCQTSIRPRQTHEPSWSVTFTETWPPCLSGYCPPPFRWRHHTWQVIEGETIVQPGAKPHVYVTRSRGARAPQDYK